jgi:hypothetical protein
MQTHVWRGLDAPRMEVAHVESWERARGTQIGVSYELRWELEGQRLQVEIVGGPSRELVLGDADFFDLHDSPFFNSLPVMRDGLLHGGPARDYVMRFVQRPDLADEPSDQRYTPLGDRTVRYESGGYQADIEFDGDGFVTLYHDYLERLT